MIKISTLFFSLARDNFCNSEDWLTIRCIVLIVALGSDHYLWQGVVVAVSLGYDTCFAVRACDGLYQLIKSMGLD